MELTLNFHFFAVPAHALATGQRLAEAEKLEPQLLDTTDLLDRALAGAEYRSYRVRDRVRALLQGDAPPPLEAPGPTFGPAALFAQPPQDLPALLRTADQLDKLTVREAGEKALVWKCGQCATRYAVPVSL